MWGFYSLPVTSAPPALGGIFLAGSYVPPIGGVLARAYGGKQGAMLWHWALITDSESNLTCNELRVSTIIPFLFPCIAEHYNSDKTIQHETYLQEKSRLHHSYTEHQD
jgi:hypothetical protein